jgi:putative tryptophan/tyrosine transport system substrate-binding protein
MRRREFIQVSAITSAAAWLLPTSAQQATMPVIGFLSGRAAQDSGYLVDAFREGLREVGYSDGETVSIVYRWADGDYDRLPGLASELLRLNVLVLVAVGGDSSAIAAKQATSTVPIVFGMGNDPIKAGLVASFNRPGGNATGYTLLTGRLEAKRVGLLQELMPTGSMLGVLINSNFPPAAGALNEIENATRSIRRELVVGKADNDAEMESAFAMFARRRVGAVLVAGSPFFDTRRHRIIELAAEHRIPAMYQFREYAVAGGLISYGPRIEESYKQAGFYVGRILRGAKPNDLPVLQSERFELVINMKTANALGLTIPSTMQLLADEVID